jgi:hypothetical protein
MTAALAVFAPACFGDSILPTNGSFELGNRSSTVSLTTHPVGAPGCGISYGCGPAGGASAATGWNIWNNDTNATTTTQLCTATACDGGAPFGSAPGTLPPAPIDGLYTLHVVTTATDHNNGIYTTFAPIAGPTLDSIWVYVVQGGVAEGAGNGGATQLNSATAIPTGSWQQLVSTSPGGSVNEMIVYATKDATPAEFYVDAASVTSFAASTAAPEPSSMVLLLFPLAGLLLRKKLK